MFVKKLQKLLTELGIMSKASNLSAYKLYKKPGLLEPKAIEMLLDDEVSESNWEAYDEAAF